MSEWWSYRPSDFLLFSARTYQRLFELYNAEVWPVQFAALAIGVALLFVALRGGARSARTACLLLALCWLWVAWAFHLQRYAAINWAATWFAAAFAVQALLLGWAAFGAGDGAAPGRRHTGLALLLFALVVHPLLGILHGRPWTQAEVFALAPDPTVLGTLGVLLVLPPRQLPAWLLWPIPLSWCVVSGATLATMNAPDALVLPAAALLAVAVAPARDGPARRSRT